MLKKTRRYTMQTGNSLGRQMSRREYARKNFLGTKKVFNTNE